ncbi:hypothetical protein [Barnesiella intestinihominis]|uniref:hypothetical protein n=1 Tax=Barnesiella intestinihominis TaxID=487174 RepID=UPI0018975D6F|nr:hypothetical protein [Barnesiella intestinihominis]MDB0679378.1 hypothetical protein [Barnesiella intestinihominis]MDB0685030.1 hypothetical protein [Barnesiella intestinihominis]
MESEDKLNREKLVISDLCLEYLFIKSIINYDQYVDIHNRIKKFQEDNHVIVNLNQLSSARFYYNDDPDKSKTLKVKLITSSMNTFKRGDIYLRSLEDSLFESRLPVIREMIDTNTLNLYTEIETIEDLDILVHEFGCHIVYGDKTEEGIMIIEKYDTKRE